MKKSYLGKSVPMVLVADNESGEKSNSRIASVADNRELTVNQLLKTGDSL